MIQVLTRKARGAGRRLLCQLTATGRSLPDWLIIGAQKAGTTSLYDYLVRHPDVQRAGRKEVHFFDNAFHKGELWYRSFFPLEHDRKLHSLRTTRRLTSGEATPYYLFHPQAPARVARTVPNARLIVLLRDPVDRAFSHYMHEKVRGNEPLSFEEALLAERKRLDGAEWRMMRHPGYRSREHQVFSYFARGLYAEQLLRWHRHFPREQMLVLGAERFFADPQSAMADVFRFLGLPAHTCGTFEIRNQGRYAGGLSATTAARLRMVYFEPNKELFDLTGMDFGWNEAPAASGNVYRGREQNP